MNNDKKKEKDKLQIWDFFCEGYIYKGIKVEDWSRSKTKQIEELYKKPGIRCISCEKGKWPDGYIDGEKEIYWKEQTARWLEEVKKYLTHVGVSN